MNKAIEEIWQTIQALNKTWTKENNPDKLKDYFHKDMVAIIPNQRVRLEGKEACIASWKAFTKAAKIHSWKEIDPKIQVYEDRFAVVTYYFDMSFDMNGQAIKMQGRDMFSLIKENGRWLVVADQFSVNPNKKQMKIEKALIEDLPEILELQKLAFQSEAELYNDFSISPLTQTLEEIQKEYHEQVFLKAVIKGRIIGSVRAMEKENSIHIGRLIVHPEFQNKGTGTKLMNQIEAIFPNAKRYELFTGCKSEKNIYIYQKLGYRIFKEKKINNSLTLVEMEK